MRSGTWKVIASVLAIGMCVGGCDILKRRASSDMGSDGEGNPSKQEGFVLDDSGTTRLLPPDEMQQRKGVEVSTTELGNVGARSIAPGHGWISETKARKNGSFLLASTSHAGTLGGDMIRRIDLGSSSKDIKEFDYDDETAGTQGAYIYVPDEMRNAVSSKLIDADGMFTGTICALIPGPNKTVIAMSGGTEGGYGFVINPYEEASAFTPLQAFKMPYASAPCRAVYSEQTKKLYVVDVVRTESNGGQNGIFVADIYNDNRGSIASFYAFDLKYRINSHSLNNFQDIELFKDSLYLLSGNGRFESEWDAVVYRVPLNKVGEPLFENMSYTRTNNPIVRSDGCSLSSWNIGSLALVEQSDKNVLLTSGTTAVIAWEIGEDGSLKKIDMNAKKPGIQGYNTEDNGQGGLKFQFSPDGKSLLMLPHCRSNKNKVKIGGSDQIFAFNITQFSVPELKVGDGIDIAYRELLTSLKDAAYRPPFSMTMRDFAVGPKHIAVLGSSASNLSGLSAGSDVTIVDRDKKTPISFNKPSDMRRAHEIKYGFKLAAGDKAFDHSEQNSHAVLWIP